MSNCVDYHIYRSRKFQKSDFPQPEVLSVSDQYKLVDKMADGEKSKSKKTVRLEEDSTKSEDKKDEKILKKLSLSLPLCPGRPLRTRKPSKG